ncbi:uncharacterized protein FOMMEDRAFT_167107 [Fomitiporia mediterranea MF3/22]|uniref:uncharacterized protein n=1 Tax=Fomitiporia mediterranea (strain MF3/22) TaxID=694068 RepID=UPI0004409B4D|nr:uncharacterized protein FOMMEDRAFT_167107 [Fomitiporia mediterranea MF3/22]EJD03784.1 hypothetical protein FOMMEDRAFT_167107 [Fomitiporia mediterranea MF3/22]
MFSNWFSERNAVLDGKNDEAEANARLGSANASVGPYISDSSAQRKAAVSMESPHDAVIDKIENELRELHAAGDPHVDSSGNPDSTSQPGELSQARTRTRALPENIYDPFDGQSIGLLIHGEFEEKEDDLWTHLAQIRLLQSDIARMHAQMERLGENERFNNAGQATEDEATNVEEEAKAAKAAEFTKLSNRFNVRKEAIEAVMQKLETLSHSVNDFHSSRAPIFRPLASQNTAEYKKNLGNPATASSQVTESARFTELNNKILSASEENVLKDSPESFSHDLLEHADT